ncbi:MAG: xylulokinase [Candidatus Izemoplasmatales bacterium]|jgi:xylulokinase
MYIGVDLGTSSVKLVLVDKSGAIIKSASRSYPIHLPKPSWTEQNPNDWYSETLNCLREIVKGYEHNIEGIGFSGQMHGLVMLDASDKVLRNALLWNDQRTVREVDYLNKEIGIQKLLKYTGNIAMTGMTAPKIMWVKANEPEIFKRVKKIMLPKDYLIYKLSGIFASDVSDLSGTLFFNPATRSYSQEMLKILGITESTLPKVYESYQVVGLLKDDIRLDLGITNEVKIIAGGGDQPVGAIGTGIVDDGGCSVSLGTSGVIFVASEKFRVDHQSHFQSGVHASGDYLVMAVMLNAAGTIKWWNEVINDNIDYAAFYDAVETGNPDESLFFLPYLSGERAPINDPYAKGVMFGLASHHQKKDLDRAILEGVTFALKQSFLAIKDLGIPITSVRLTGGGAKSDVWAQMIADIFLVNVEKISVEEGPALGAAILAMVGCGLYPSPKEAAKAIVSIQKAFVPNNKKSDTYQKKYWKFAKLYPCIKDLYRDFYS